MKRVGQASRNRTGLTAFGALAGVALWAIGRQGALMDGAPHLFVLVATFVGVFSIATLAMAGPLRLVQAAIAALVLAAVLAPLFFWASFRFASFPAFVAGGDRVVAAGLMIFLPLPYVIALLAGRGLLDYATLYEQSWAIVTRLLGALLFVGLVRLVLLLSATLLETVHVETLSRLLSIGWLAFGLTGAVFGLAIALLDDLRDYFSPFIAQRMLRLLVPVALVIEAVFLVALPLHGFSAFFAGTSTAQTLLALALGSATLISTATDETDADAVRLPLMRRMTQLLAVLLPILAGLALTAVWIRVQQYGWTPSRIAAGFGAVLALAYGLLYAAAAIRGEGWMGRIRATNAWMALVVLGALALSFTPVLDAQAISARNQVERFERGQSQPQDLDVATIRQDWGLAGAAAIARLTALADQPGQGALKARLAEATAPAQSAVDLRNVLRRQIALQPDTPEAAALREALLRDAQTAELHRWASACALRLSDGHPGCVLVTGAFEPARGGLQGLFLYRLPEGGLRAQGVVRDTTQGILRPDTATLGPMIVSAADAEAVLAAIFSGEARLAPAQIGALTVGPRQILILPWAK
ncbi:MAG: DUF4153 domain-containing protein [Paracoccaceae bacterium]|nr:DUF4153 domain-containing protein [Paracoccaceae bacterium]